MQLQKLGRGCIGCTCGTWLVADEALGRKFVALDPVQSQPPSETPSLSPQALPASPVQPVIAPAPALASGPLASGPYPQPPPAIHAASIQPPVAERRPQLWPSAGGPLPAVPQPSGLLHLLQFLISAVHPNCKHLFAFSALQLKRHSPRLSNHV